MSMEISLDRREHYGREVLGRLETDVRDKHLIQGYGG